MSKERGKSLAWEGRCQCKGEGVGAGEDRDPLGSVAEGYSQPPTTAQGPPTTFPQLPASMYRAPAVAASLAFLESTKLPMFVQRSPIMPKKRPRKPRRMAVIMSARQAWMYPGEVGYSMGS